MQSDDEELQKSTIEIAKPRRKPLNITVPGEEAGNQKQGWVQTDKMAHDAMWKIGMKNSIALTVLHYMVAHVKRGSGGLIISAKALAEDLDVTPRTIQSAIAVLRQWHFIQVVKTGNTNIYILNSKVAWQGKRGQRYATFNAELKVIESEQDTDVDTLVEEAENLIPIPDMHFLGGVDDDVVESGDVTGSNPPD